MPKMTQQQAICKALEARGWTSVDKYYSGAKAFKSPISDSVTFVGKSGSARNSIFGLRSDARPIANSFRLQLLQEGGYKSK